MEADRPAEDESRGNAQICHNGALSRLLLGDAI